MNLRRRLVLLLAIIAALPMLGMAQQPSTPASDQGPALLPVNYRVTLVDREGEKQVGALSNLTCTPSVFVDGTIEIDDRMVPENRIPISCVLKGNFQDENGIITFTYEIATRVPVPTQFLRNSGADGGRAATTIQYKDVRCAGTLRMKAGKSYEVFQTGGRTFSISISPESDH